MTFKSKESKTSSEVKQQPASQKPTGVSHLNVSSLGVLFDYRVIIIPQRSLRISPQRRLTSGSA